MEPTRFLTRPFGDFSESRTPNREHQTRFREIIYTYYREFGRPFPWRETSDPYRILVSEIMLQQTQTQRVLGYYERFIKGWENFQTLARASLHEVFRVWQGLGYNRRAKALLEIAEIVTTQYGGRLPESMPLLQKLPMIGRATAAAIMVYAFHMPEVIVETNIRRVIIHYFFEEKELVPDAEVYRIAGEILDEKNPRRWHYALMDYGVFLKSTLPNTNRRSEHYTRQGQFNNSNRQIRGAILKTINAVGAIALSPLFQALQFSESRILACIDKLESEGMIIRNGDDLRIP